MYTGLLHTHSSLRYLVLIMLLVVIAKSLLGILGRKPFEKIDNTLSLILLIVTHIQFLTGLILYFVSPAVRFGPGAMTDYRYWTVEHIFGMAIAVVLITVARSTSKRMTDAQSKHTRLFILNTVALLIIIGTIYLSGRGLIG
ncbi:MAG TPA: cytochrome B [Ohtaekwangia sp.]|nr:cytochrome B [Ohtaekwangia sp.]